MAHAWKTVRVFISSTFRDMQAERDHLVRFVFPRLREQLLSRRIHLVDVDLRWGVTSEQDATEVCREIINECRPRFLCMLGGRYGWVPPNKDRSITADEVHYGVLDQALKDRGFAYFYFRDHAATTGMVETTPGEFREPQGSDNQNKLAELKQVITAAGLNPFTYPAQWDNESSRLTGLKKLGDRVHDELLDSMKSDPELRDRFLTDTAAQFDEFDEENAAMEAFVEERSERFVLGSRESVLEELLAHASATDGQGYVCLIGAPGSGKSALLAHLSRHSTFNDQPSTLLIRHFVGASPGSTDVRRTLRRLCHELKAACPDITADIPDEPEKLRVAFLDFLRQASAHQRVVMLLDAVNQFDPAPNSTGLHWLPAELPANSRVILSALDGPALEELRRRLKPREIELKPLTAVDGEAIIEQFRKRYRKKFEPDQIELLLGKDESGKRNKSDSDKPLYLLAALEELRTLGSYEEITRRIADLPPTTHELFAWILQRLENDDGFRVPSGQQVGRELVSRFVAFLGASRYGLSQRELTDLLDAGDPHGNVAALLHLLRPYLMRRGELLDYYHGQFREAVEGEHLNTGDRRLTAHLALATYFHDVADPNREGQWKGNSPHALSELPYHQIHAQAWPELVDTLENIFFLEAKVTYGMAFDLAGDFIDTVQHLPAIHPHYRILCLLEEALRRDVHFIARHAKDYPQGLFQCLWNSCWWYDCPDAARHYESNEGPWDETGDKLYFLLDTWRKVRSAARPGSSWVRFHRPPTQPLRTGQLAIFQHEEWVRNVVFSPDSRCLATASIGTIRLWDVRTSEPLAHWRLPLGAGLAFSPDGKLIASGVGTTIQLWDAVTGEPFEVLRGATSNIRDIVFSPNGQMIVGAGGNKLDEPSDNTVRVWNVDKGEEVAVFSGHQDPVNSVAFSPDGKLIASGSEDHSVRIWDLVSGRNIAVLRRHSEGVNSVAFAPTGHRLVSASGIFHPSTPHHSGDYTLRVWDVSTHRELAVLAGHRCGVSSIAFSPDGRWIASGSQDDTVRLWCATTFKEVTVLSGHTGPVTSVAFAPDSRRLASASGGHIFGRPSDNTARLWDLTAGRSTPKLLGHTGPALVQTFSPNGDYIASKAMDRTVRVWDVVSGSQVAVFENRAPNIGAPGTFSPDGRSIAVVSVAVESGTDIVRLHDLVSGLALADLRGHSGSLTCLAFSADGNRVATGSKDQTVRIWGASTGKELKVLQGHRDSVLCVAFSPDQVRIASGSSDKTVRVWDPVNGRALVTLRGHEDSVVSLSFSPDGQRLATGSNDKTVRLWDVATGHQINILQVGEWPVKELAFAPDGERIVATDRDLPTRHWSAYNGREIELPGTSSDSVNDEAKWILVRQRMDVATFAKRRIGLPYRLLACASETLVESASTGAPVAWLAGQFIEAHVASTARTWCSARGYDIYIFSLESFPASQKQAR